MTMRIEFSDGDVVTGDPDIVTLVVNRKTLGALREVLTYLALIEAKAGRSQFANDLLYLENELERAIISNNG